jgi:hypothetical protein
MAELIRVSLDDEPTATALERALADDFDARVERRDGGGYELLVRGDRPTDRLIVDLLSRLERWLGESDLEETTVIIGGRPYRLPAPAG